jgi:iron complex outermembrane receptor protein
MNTPKGNKNSRPFCLLLFIAAVELLPAQTLESDSSRMSLTIKEIVVSGRKRTSPLQELTVEPPAWESSISYLSADEIKKTGAIYLFDALKYSTNGLPSTQGRRKKHYYLLRGQNVASDYALNGISLSTNGAGPMAEWIEAPALLPAAMIESVEVVRSGNSLLLGFSGLNGVVNVKTKSFDKPTTELEADYATFNTLRYGLLHGAKIGNVRYAFSLSNSRTDGPEGRHGYENLWNCYGKLSYHRDKLTIALENFYTYGVRHVTQAVFDSLAAPQSQLADLWEYDPMRYNIATLSVRYKASDRVSTELQLSCILNRMDLYPDRYFYTSTGKVVLISDSIQRKRMLDEPDSIFTAAVFQAFSPAAGHVIRTGVMYASSANYAHGRSKKQIVSATLLDQQTIGDWDWHAGMKVIREYYNYYTPGQGFGDEAQAVANRWQSPMFNVSTGISRRFDPVHTFNFVLNSGALSMDNTALQQVVDDDGEAVKDLQSGKIRAVSLKREVRTGIELGWLQELDGVGRATWTAFFLNQKNTSEYTQTPYFDERNTLRYYMKNIDLRTYGVELAFHSRLLNDRWSWGGNLSYKYVSQEESLSRSRKKYTKQPPFIANVIASYGKTDSDWRVHLMGKYVSSYRTDRFLREEVSIGNYLNVDANVNYFVRRMGVDVYASIVNVFDVRYATVSPLYPDFGRQVKAGVRFHLR